MLLSSDDVFRSQMLNLLDFADNVIISPGVFILV